jgi:hypothetical protein
MTESKDLFLIDTRCTLNQAIEEAMQKNGFGVKVKYKVDL